MHISGTQQVCKPPLCTQAGLDRSRLSTTEAQIGDSDQSSRINGEYVHFLTCETFSLRSVQSKTVPAEFVEHLKQSSRDLILPPLIRSIIGNVISPSIK